MAQAGIAVATVLLAGVTVGGLVYTLIRPRLVSLVLILVLAVNWGIAASLAGKTGLLSIEQILFIPPRFWAGAEPHTAGLSVFIHFDLFHLAFNCLALYIFGIMLEEKHGNRLVVAVFLLAGVLGNLAFAAANPSQSAVLLGASGGVMGIIGALARLSPHERIAIFGLGAFLPNVRMWVVALVFATIDLALAITSEFANIQFFGTNARVAYIAHLGGLASGLLLAPVLVRVNNPLQVKKVEGSGIQRLVPGGPGKQIVQALERETDQEIIRTWMKRIEEIGKCPECGAGLKAKVGGRFRCERGHLHRVGR